MNHIKSGYAVCNTGRRNGDWLQTKLCSSRQAAIAEYCHDHQRWIALKHGWNRTVLHDLHRFKTDTAQRLRYWQAAQDLRPGLKTVRVEMRWST